MPRPLARDALGLGLRSRHYRELCEPWPELDYFELISENFLNEAEGPRYHLDRVRERYPIVLLRFGLCWIVPYLFVRSLIQLARSFPAPMDFGQRR